MTRAVDARSLVATDGSDIRLKVGSTLPPLPDLSQVDANGNRLPNPEGTFALPGWQVWGLATVNGGRSIAAYEMQADGTWAGPFSGATGPPGPVGATGGSSLAVWVNGSHALNDLVVDPVGSGVYRCTAAHVDAAGQNRPDLTRFALVGDFAGRYPCAGDPRSAVAQQPVTSVGAPTGTFFGRVQGAGMVAGLEIRVAVSAGTIGLAYHPDSGATAPPAPAAPQFATGAVPCPPVGDAVLALNGGLPFPVYHNDWFSLWVDNPTCAFQGAGTSGVASDLWLGWSGVDAATAAQVVGTAPSVVPGPAGGFVIAGR